MATTEVEATAGERWTEYLPLDQLRPDPRNPKLHADELRASFGRFGYAELITLDERTGMIVAGHGRRELLLDDYAAGQEPPEGVRVDGDGAWLVPVSRGWRSTNDVEAFAYLVASNHLGELGGWQRDLLAEGLEYLSDTDAGLEGTGYTPEGLVAMLEVLSAVEVTEPAEPDRDQTYESSDGSLLSLSDVSFGDPHHSVHDGEIYRITGEHATHWLVIADVMTGWPTWGKFLVEGALFVPYPGPYAALSRKADLMTLVLVQPDHFLAGHLLDKYEAVRGADCIELIQAEAA